jgi:exodeoxyribonuclease V beta subunit
MTTFQKPLPFDATKVELAHSNLIEASAGTGKTYSIAILALRLVVEKGLGIEQILMVTFTKSAVAELEERIRLFIREAQRFVLGNEIADKTIQTIVENALLNKNEEEQDRIKKSLKNAVLFLDETSIFTIHSFCQKTLTEFAFETGQIFGNELLSSQDELLRHAVNAYWRKNITSIEVNLLSGLVNLGLSRDQIIAVVKLSLAGKRFVTDLLIDPNEAPEEFAKLIQQKQDQEVELTLYYERNRTELIDLISSSKPTSYEFKAFHKAVYSSEEFISVYLSKYNGTRPGYLAKKFPEFYSLVEAFAESIELVDNYCKGVINWIYKEATLFAIAQVQETKQRKNLLTFDDLITNLHEAVTGVDNYDLIRGLQYKYRAVFIDEFQDTDKLQFDIFDTAFGEKTTLFYIGDPKQSIYAFRQADIETYKKAKQGVKYVFSMDKNYRSTEQYIAGMNLFFEPQPNFDAFADESIRYEKVSQGKDVGQLTVANEPVVPISFSKVPTKGQVNQQVAAEILHVLNTHQIKGNKVKPSDIGVLVRSKGEAASIKKELSILNIPAITIDESKVMISAESKVIYYVLKATLEPNRGNINRALLNRVVGKQVNDILTLNEEIELSHFYQFQELWKWNGVYSVLLKFITKYQIKSTLLDGDHTDGERMITNIYQIMELLHKYESSKNASPEEVLNWMHQFFEGKEVEGDEFTQRVESDKDAVNIVTIHKSKGLAYPIVFAPFLDLDAKHNTRHEIVEYRDEEQGDYVFSTDKSDEQLRIYEQQQEPENRRLIYVALTRAIYKCFITRVVKESKKPKPLPNAGLNVFVNALENEDVAGLMEELPAREEPTEKYVFHKTKVERIARSTEHIKPIDNTWRVLSYSGLNTHHATLTKRTQKDKFASSYDEFIFKLLPKGSITGEFLHHLFEYSDYTSNKHWEKVIGMASRLYGRAYKEDLHSQYVQHISEVVQANLVDATGKSFQLNQLSSSQKLAEMEFYFKLDDFNTSKLNQLSDLYELNTNKDFNGMMNGFIDLFFEHEGKYYILDWKSNHLGSELTDYDEQGTSQAMKDNNYHLQYLIYTVAVKRFLKNRITDFDYQKHFGGVYYLFLRGVRANQTSGVFYSLPDEKLINEIDAVLS